MRVDLSRLRFKNLLLLLVVKSETEESSCFRVERERVIILCADMTVTLTAHGLEKQDG